MNLLVAADTKETTGLNEKIVFAGDWFKSNTNFEKKFSHRKYSFFKYNFKNSKSYKKYILDLRSRITGELVTQLNKIHKIKYSEKLWKILLEPWLTMYLENNYYRWDLIRELIKKNRNLKFIYLNKLENFSTMFDSWEFKSLIGRSDIYNQYLFQKILSHNSKKEKKNIYFQYSDANINKDYKTLLVKRRNFLSYLRSFLNLFLFPIVRKNKFFLDIHFSGLKNLFLNIKLKQLPYKNQDTFSIENYLKLFSKKSIDLNLRKKITFTKLKKTKFEKYILKNLKFDIPTSVLENFSYINNYVNKITLKPKIIVSDTQYQHNLIFKFWLTKCINNKSKLFIADHGGAFMHRSKPKNSEGGIIDSHDEEISDLSLRWHKPLSKNNVQMPALKILRYKKIRSNYSKLENILMIGFETTKYPRYFLVLPISGQTLYQENYIKMFYKNLNTNLKKYFLFKHYPKSVMSNGFNIDDRIRSLLPDKQLISNYKKAIKKAKVVICNYPSTTFLEAMISGPTILLYKPEFWKFTSDFDNLINKLKRANILFDNPAAAAKHLNKVWDNVNIWWESKEVQSVRNQFFSEACDSREKYLDIWKNFLISQENEYFQKKRDKEA